MFQNVTNKKNATTLINTEFEKKCYMFQKFPKGNTRALGNLERLKNQNSW